MKRYIIAEIFVWTIILTIVFCIGIFSYSKIFVEPNIYTIQFKDIDGITKGSPVRFMGINVGYVRKLKNNNKTIDVQIIITKKDMKIPNGTVAQVAFYGLGGSKSIELMPPDTSCNVGILSVETIRINDIANEAKDMVEVIEIIERYVKSLNKDAMKKTLETVVKFKDDNFKKVDSEIKTIETNIEQKVEIAREKQQNLQEKIKTINEHVEKLNEFIKK